MNVRLVSIGGFIAAVVLIVAGLSGAVLQDTEPKDRIEVLIRQLSDRRFSKREEASRELENIGERALPALRKAAAATTDKEGSRRIKELLRSIMLAAGKSRATGMQLATIEAGEFQMGSPPAESGRRTDETRHKVRITVPCLLGVHEVTQDEYQLVMKTNPSWFSAAGGGKDKVAGMKTGKFPVESVSWFDAVEFCNRLSKLDGFKPFYDLDEVEKDGTSIKKATVKVLGGNGYRLPTEAEWEHACRAERTTLFHFGNETTRGALNCKPMEIPSGYGSVLKWPDLARSDGVGNCKANDWGLHDMHGNVAEWCQDWYDKDYYVGSPVNDPKGPEKGTHRVVRGGSWLIGETSCRSASRQFRAPSERHFSGGFRVARTPSP